MDLNMPVMDGMRSASTLRLLHEKGVIDLVGTKIIMHSAIQNAVSDDLGVFDGICKYLTI